MTSQFYQKSTSLASPEPQAAKGLQRLDSILEGMEYAVPECAFEHIKLSTSSAQLRPFPLGQGTILSISGSRVRRCECGTCLVEAKLDNYITICLCKTCGKPRLTQGRKLDADLIGELLANPGLRSWDKLFCETLAKAKKLAPWQKEKLVGIAEKLGIGLEYNCSLSEAERGAQ